MTRLLGPHGVHLADIVLLALLAEAALLLLHPRLRRALPPRSWCSTLVAGLLLVLALRAALSGAPLAVVALLLLLAFPIQLLDLRLRSHDRRS